VKAAQEYLVVSSCETLVKDLGEIKLNAIKDFPKSESYLFRDTLYSLIGK